MKHLCFSYHTCLLEEPGVALAGGMNTFLRGLLAGLAARGTETLVLTRSLGDALERVPFVPGVEVWKIPCQARQPWDREQAYRSLDAFVEGCRRHLAGLEFDSLSAHYWMSGLAARRLYPERPLALMYHTLQALKGGPADGLAATRRQAEVELARQAAAVVFLSGSDRALSQTRLPDLVGRARIIRPGCDPAFTPRPSPQARARLGLPPEVPLVGLVARPDPLKNVAAARAAVAGLRAGGSEVELVVAGSEGEASAHRQEGVRLLGSLPHQRMPEFYAAIDLLVAPSYYESFGLATLEALACGRPVLVSDQGYWAGIGRRTGALRVTDLECLTPAVRELLSDAAARADLARRGLQLARCYTWERAARKWQELLRQAGAA